MKRDDYVFVLTSFLVWRLLIFIPIFLAPFFIPLHNAFLGGGLQNYLNNPYFWSWANFDGEHYISIARIGYGNFEQAFFPLYPFLIHQISRVYGFKSLDLMVATGLFISNVSFLLSLVGLYKLIRIDYKKNVARLTILLLLFFPTSFYFGAVYTESLFLCLVVWSFYFLRRENYFLASLLGMFAASARVVGIVLLPIYIISMTYWKRPIKTMINLLFIPVGILSYMYYSYLKWGDPLKFFNVASSFGEQRSDHLIILPQVFYRYFVKIIPNISWSYFPVIFTTLLEISVALLFLGLIFYLFYHLMRGTMIVKSSYWLYLVFAYIVPTLSGSFSSLPRYALVLFPAFIYFAYFAQKLPKVLLVCILIAMSLVAIIAHILFIRGYFVS